MNALLVASVAVVALVIGALLGWHFASRLVTPLKIERDARATESEEWRLKFNEAVVNLAAEAEKSKRLEQAETELTSLRETAASLRSQIAAFERGEAERERAHQTQLRQLTELESKLETRFGELAGRAVENAHDRFLSRADEKLGATGIQNEAKLKELLQPMQVTLQRYEADLRQLENDRKGAYQSLTDQIGFLKEGQEKVANEALRLRTALRSSTGDVGRWGEDQCRNVLERAGLQEGIDFEEQVSTDAAGDRSKPDFVVRVPGERQIVIDVKCSLDAYMGASAASEAGDEALKEKLLDDHKRAIRAHAQSLMKRSYQDKFKNSATFVVMFVPGENFLHAAIQRDRELLSDAQKGNLIIVGPTNLISLVLSVAALRDQARLAERAEQIGEIGKRLYDNLATLGKNAHLMSGAVRSVVSNWNNLVGTLDGHMLSTARKFDELGVGKGSPTVREVEPIDVLIREPQKLISISPANANEDEELDPAEEDTPDEPPQIAAE
jgi:DNA recombination protein RmuC